MNGPLAIDLFCGLGGWTEGLLSEGYAAIGFDIERHVYGEHHYPAQLVLQDVLTLHGSQFRDAALIVASPPCQGYSYRAMPWSRAKALPPPDNSLFDACFRIQREACEAAGRHIPLVVENVRGAIPWVGRSRWNYGSFHLWGDVPALMPMTKAFKNSGARRWNDFKDHGNVSPAWTTAGTKNTGGSCFNVAHNTTSGCGQNLDGRKEVKVKECTCIYGPEVSFDTLQTQHQTCPRHTNRRESDGVKQHKSGRAWFADPDTISGSTSSKSTARKAASALIARIPFPLAQYIAAVYRPERVAA